VSNRKFGLAFLVFCPNKFSLFFSGFRGVIWLGDERAYMPKIFSLVHYIFLFHFSSLSHILSLSCLWESSTPKSMTELQASKGFIKQEPAQHMFASRLFAYPNWRHVSYPPFFLVLISLTLPFSSILIFSVFTSKSPSC
jgi:hypothetical protein